MSTKRSAARDAAETAQQRAQAEQFSYNVEGSEMVEVTNETHENPGNHQYTVSTDDGTLDAFPSEDKTSPNPKTATVTASVTSRAGNAFA